MPQETKQRRTISKAEALAILSKELDAHEADEGRMTRDDAKRYLAQATTALDDPDAPEWRQCPDCKEPDGYHSDGCKFEEALNSMETMMEQEAALASTLPVKGVAIICDGRIEFMIHKIVYDGQDQAEIIARLVPTNWKTDPSHTILHRYLHRASEADAERYLAALLVILDDETMLLGNAESIFEQLDNDANVPAMKRWY